jgi:hypothetical protein
LIFDDSQRQSQQIARGRNNSTKRQGGSDRVGERETGILSIKWGERRVQGEAASEEELSREERTAQLLHTERERLVSQSLVLSSSPISENLQLLQSRRERERIHFAAACCTCRNSAEKIRVG